MGRGRNVQTTPEQPRGLLGIIKTPGRKTTSPELEAAKTKAKTVTRKDAQLLCEVCYMRLRLPENSTLLTSTLSVLIQPRKTPCACRVYLE